MQGVDRIQPVAPQPSLRTTARDHTRDNFGVGTRTVELREGGGEADGESTTVTTPNWTAGIEWTPVCQVSHQWPRACNDDEREKEPPTARSKVGTDAFVTYTPLQCDWDDPESSVLEAASLEKIEAHSSWALARALWLGEELPDTVLVDGEVMPQPSLRRNAIDISAGAVDLSVGVAQLLQAYEDCSHEGGAVLHIPGIAMTYALGGGSGGGTVARLAGSQYVGPLGSVISPGPGYPDTAGANGADGSGPLLDSIVDPDTYVGGADDELWIYVTGPVEYALTKPRVLPEREVDRVQGLGRTNRTEIYAERFGIIRFDPCCVYATLVNNPTVP